MHRVVFSAISMSSAPQEEATETKYIESLFLFSVYIHDSIIDMLQES